MLVPRVTETFPPASIVLPWDGAPPVDGAAGAPPLGLPAAPPHEELGPFGTTETDETGAW